MTVDESLTRLPQKGCNKPIKFIAYTIHHYAQSLTNPFDEAMATGRLAKYDYHPVAMWHFRSRQSARFFFSPVGTALLLLFFSSLLFSFCIPSFASGHVLPTANILLLPCSSLRCIPVLDRPTVCMLLQRWVPLTSKAEFGQAAIFLSPEGSLRGRLFHLQHRRWQDSALWPSKSSKYRSFSA